MENGTKKIRDYIFSEVGFIITVVAFIGGLVYPTWQTKLEMAVVKSELLTLNKSIEEHLKESKEKDNKISDLDKRVSVLEFKIK